MVRRLDDCDMHPEERLSAVRIRDAALQLQHIFYYTDVAVDLPDETREMLLRLYRGLCTATRHYFEDTGILWEAPAPATQFKKVHK